ncbi:MAG: LysR family transcriptional regulator, partial [Myxococcota bacterium]
MTTLQDFDLNLLRTLEALLDTRSVQYAAARRKLTPSGASRALSRLRTVFQDPLLVRNGRRFDLTPFAADLRGPLGRILRDVESLAHPKQFDPSARWTVRTSGADYIEQVFFPALLPALREHAPGVRLHHRTTRQPGLDLVEGRVDVSIGVRGSLPEADLASTVLLEDELVWVMAKDHPLAKRRATERAYLSQQHVLVAPSGEPGGVVDEALQKRGKTREVFAIVTGFSSALAVVAQSELTAALPRHFIRAAGRTDLVHKRLPVPVEPFTIAAYWLPRMRGDAAHRWFRQRLRDAA